MKLQYFISVYILHAEDKADVMHGVPSGLCHHVPHVLGLQRHMNVYDKQIVEIQVPFLFSVEKKKNRICKGCPGRCWFPPAQWV